MKITIEHTGETKIIELASASVLALENDLLDLPGWVEDAITGKVDQCKKRMGRTEVERLKADPDISTMPATADGLIESAVAAPGYKNRVKREEEDARMH